MRRALLLLLTLANGACGPALALAAPRPSKPLTLTAYPQALLLRPGSAIRVSAYVPHPERYAQLVVGWEYTYPGGGGHSVYDLGEGARRQYVLYLRHITPGTVWVEAELVDADGIVVGRDRTTAEARGVPW